MNNTVLVVIVLVVLLVGFIMWQNSQAQQSQNEQMLWLMQNQNNQGQANIWSSMGDWGNIIGGIGGLFGGGSSGEVNGDTYTGGTGTRFATSPIIPPYPPSTQMRATEGFDNLQNMVEYGYGIELNA